MRLGNRTIKVNKHELINKVRENKEAHLQEYHRAVDAYKEEALKQLTQLQEDAKAGKTNLKLELVKPVDNSANYDKIIEMFQWEVEDFVHLHQDEFREYVQDENDFARRAKLSNTSYL